MPRRQKKRNLKAPPGIRRKPGRLPEGRPFDQLPPGGEDLPPVDKTGDDLLLKIIVTDLTSCRDIIRFAGTDTRFRRVVIENLPYLYIKLRQVVPYFPDMDFEDTPENNYQKFVRECHNFFDNTDYYRGYDTEGYDEYGYNFNGYDREGYDEYGLNGYRKDRRGFYLGHYDLEGYDEMGYDINEFDRNGFHAFTGTRFDKAGFDRNGFHAFTGTRFDEAGFDKEGYDIDGYDIGGRDRTGLSQEDYEDMYSATPY